MLRDIADQFQRWLKGPGRRSATYRLPTPRKAASDDFVDPYFKGADLDAVVDGVLKAREPARIMTAIGDSKANRWHLQIANPLGRPITTISTTGEWGRMFVHLGYLPFSARRSGLNQHHWLANRMREEGIDFQQCANAFTRCAKPERLRSNSPTRSPLGICCIAAKSGWRASRHSLPPGSGRNPAAGIDYSSRR